MDIFSIIFSLIWLFFILMPGETILVLLLRKKLPELKTIEDFLLFFISGIFFSMVIGFILALFKIMEGYSYVNSIHAKFKIKVNNYA